MAFGECSVEIIKLESKPSLLVLGGTGFIGSKICERAIHEGFEVTSISMNRPKRVRYFDKVNYLYSDLRHPEPFADLKQNRFSYVVNASGYVDHSSLKSGGSNVINQHFSAIVKIVEFLDWDYLIKFINIGSSDEYGKSLQPAIESQREQPISPYSFSKVAASHFLQMMHISESFPVTTLRLFLTYGPGQNLDRFIPQIILGCLSEEEFDVSEGKQLRDFCYIDDVIDAVMLSLVTKKTDGLVLNIASGEPVEVRKVVQLISKLTKKGYPQLGKKPYRSNESMALYANRTAAMKKLGWNPKVSLEHGLNKTIDWFQENG